MDVVSIDLEYILVEHDKVRLFAHLDGSDLIVHVHLVRGIDGKPTNQLFDIKPLTLQRLRWRIRGTPGLTRVSDFDLHDRRQAQRAGATWREIAAKG